MINDSLFWKFSDILFKVPLIKHLSSEEANNLSDHSIQFVLDDSTVLQLGNKNKLASVSYGGGDAGGGNATITYSMTNSNDLAVMHSGDPLSGGLTANDYFVNWFA